MIRLATLASFVTLLFSAGHGWAAILQSDLAQTGSADAAIAMTLSAGAKVELAVMVPVRAKTAKPGDPFYAQTDFPVTTGNSIAIPAGTYVEGRIQAVQLPTRRSRRAELQILFTKIMFANGYTIALPRAAMAGAAPADAGSAETAARVTVEVSTSNDLLLDNGAQIEMTLAAPLALDAKQVLSAIPLSRAPEPGKFRSATLCRPTPGSPGSPGTSDTVIPGSPGTPSTTIPGTPGSPDTPGSSCPTAPIVISSVPVPAQPAKSQPLAPAAH